MYFWSNSETLVIEINYSLSSLRWGKKGGGFDLAPYRIYDQRMNIQYNWEVQENIDSLRYKQTFQQNCLSINIKMKNNIIWLEN